MNMKLVVIDEILNEVLKRPTLLDIVTLSLVVLAINVGVPTSRAFLWLRFLD